MPRVVFFDIEGTLVSNNTWNTLTKHPDLPRGRILRAYAEGIPLWLLTKARMVDDTKFRHYWMVSMAKMFKGWSHEQLKSIFTWVTSRVEYHKDVVEKLRLHKQNGDTVVLVSGIFEDGAQQFAAHLGADAGIGTRLEYQAGICAGKISGESCAGTRKLEFIQAFMQANGGSADMTQCYAYADSFSDAPMLSAVGYPVATYPEDDLRTLAVNRGWTVFPAN